MIHLTITQGDPRRPMASINPVPGYSWVGINGASFLFYNGVLAVAVACPVVWRGLTFMHKAIKDSGRW